MKFDPEYRAYYAGRQLSRAARLPGETNVLLHNNCNGTFTDSTEKAGIAALKGRAMGVTAADFDLDGYPDIYVANDKTENFLFHNKRDGTFREIASTGRSGDSDRTAKTLPRWGPCLPTSTVTAKSISGFPIRVTTVCTGILGSSHVRGHYRTRRDLAIGRPIRKLGNRRATTSTTTDLPDIFIVHGGLVHMVPQEHAIFRNAGKGKFLDASGTAGPFFDARTGVKSVGRGAAFADYDNDGRMDVFLMNLGGPAILLHNTSPAAGHWIAVRLVGSEEQPRRHRRTSRSSRRRSPSAAGTNRRLRISFPGRRARALRIGQRLQDRQIDRHLARRHGADTRESRPPAG